MSNFNKDILTDNEIVEIINEINISRIEYEVPPLVYYLEMLLSIY